LASLAPTRSSDQLLCNAVSLKISLTTGEILHVFEFKAYSSGSNITTSRTASQSSTYGNKYASNANDGSESTFSHTAVDDTSAWWLLDFSQELVVESVEIVNW
jgi:hypothetical protein